MAQGTPPGRYRLGSYGAARNLARVGPWDLTPVAVVPPARDLGGVEFFELAYLDVKPTKRQHEVDAHLKQLRYPNPELVPHEVREKSGSGAATSTTGPSTETSRRTPSTRLGHLPHAEGSFPGEDDW
ncbi:MAG: hypothetical protein M3O70_06595 [Actinomycetota bacterium]|nr:hypothetical protein [Actinomycetota bacterium]